MRAPRFAALVPLIAAPVVVGAVGTAFVLFRRRKELAPALLALAATLAAGQGTAGAAVFPVLDPLKTGRAFYERIRPRVSHGEPLAYYGETYHSYAILVLRRRTEHFRTEAQLAAWVDRTPGALVLADASEQRRWTQTTLLNLTVLDRQPVGSDEVLLLRR